MTKMTGAHLIDRVGQIAINVRDVARATTFYRDVLGLTFLFAAPPGLAFFDCGGVRLMLTTPESAENASMSSVIYYTVPDIIAAHSTLAAKAVAFEEGPHIVARMEGIELWMTSLRDSEGNLLALMCEKKV
ncbi:MAG: VOC family protein [Gemmatimonadales bacterium]